MRPLLTPGWLARHGIAAFLVIACAGLTWWQVTRAMDGNVLSFGYALLWPVFGAFIVLIWVREARQAVRGTPAERSDKPTAPGYRAPMITRRVAEPDGGGDASLAAYNDYLAWLNANPGARPNDYPGPERV